METMGTLRRTHYAGTLRAADAGTIITVAGSVAKCRDKGGIIFADVRDTTGILQLIFDDSTSPDVFQRAASMKNEYVIMAKGMLREREAKTDKIPTGEVELFVQELRILSSAQTTPFEIRDEINVNDQLRFKYRYLDLRRPMMHQPIVLRSRIGKLVRDYYDAHHFLEIETPMLIKSTPEGARDYLVPSRVQQGRFFALPQSPQLYKQLLMLSGFDRYFQITRCFRDEDLRADRQPEFTQIDMEMAFADEQDIMQINEGLVCHIFREALGIELSVPFARMPYAQAMARYGSDKPDLRFDLELCDVSDAVRGCGFSVFQSALTAGGSVRALNLKGAANRLTRKEIDKLTEVAKTYGAKGLAFSRWTADVCSSSFEKFLTEDEKTTLYTAAQFEQGDVLLIAADTSWEQACTILGAVRLAAAQKLELIDQSQFCFVWITDFPLLEYDAENSRYTAKHHPFTMPVEEDLPLLESNPAACRAKAYDLVLNGCELGGGSIRINDPALQSRMFHMLGFTDERAEQSFGFLTEAYRYGAPPHGGMAFGFDRLVMLIAQRDSLRDVIAFPKMQNAGEPMSGCPEAVEPQQLHDLAIQLCSPQTDN